MTLFYKPLDSITENDLQDLVGQTLEAKTIEYKEHLHDLSIPKSKLEFLVDVSSFANAIGGDIIFGIEEKSGVPTAVPGLALAKSEIDAKILQIDSIVKFNIQPRIPVTIRPLELANGNFVLIVRISKGFHPPHQVTFQNDFRFYGRSSNGKSILDVSELRTMFDLSAALRERIKNFRAERLSDIMSGETPVPLVDSPKIVLQIVPIESFEARDFDLKIITSDEQTQNLPFISDAFGYSRFHNFDGYIQYARDSNHSDAYTYTQLFRNGIIEAVDASLILKPSKGYGGSPYIPATYESHLIKVLTTYLATQQKLGVKPPILIMLSILGVKGHFVLFDQLQRSFVEGHLISKKDLLLPEIQVDTFDSNPAEILKPIFDMVANAGGWEKSPNYDEDGKRKPATSR